MTPLARPASNGHYEVVKLLLEAKADIESQDENGMTPLTRSAFWSHSEVVKLLLKDQANVESKDLRGLTPLAHAAYRGHSEVVTLLVGANAVVKSTFNFMRLSGKTKAPQCLLEIKAKVRLFYNNINGFRDVC